MLVTMLVSTGGPNGTACLVGEVYDLPDGLARQWVATGRAVEVTNDPDDAPTVVHGDPIVSVNEPPKRRRR